MSAPLLLAQGEVQYLQLIANGVAFDAAATSVLPIGNENQLLQKWAVALGLDGTGSEIQLLQKIATFYNPTLPSNTLKMRVLQGEVQYLQQIAITLTGNFAYRQMTDEIQLLQIIVSSVTA